MATYIERATQIVSGILGKNAQTEQVIKAVDSVWATNFMGLPHPADEATWTEPEVRARFFVEQMHKFVGNAINVHAEQVALEANKAAIDQSKEDYTSDFTGDD